MERDIIHSIVYTEFDDTIGPNPIFSFPSDLPENISMLVSIKTITILSADRYDESNADCRSWQKHNQADIFLLAH